MFRLPYTYSEMVSDFDDHKAFLLNNGGTILRQEDFKESKNSVEKPLIDAATKKKIIK